MTDEVVVLLFVDAMSFVLCAGPGLKKTGKGVELLVDLGFVDQVETPTLFFVL